MLQPGSASPPPRDVTRWPAASSGQYEGHDNRRRRGDRDAGAAGRRRAEARGNQVRPLSRHAPEYRVDLATGDGLGPALAGCDVVVYASNSSARKPAGILVDGSRRLTGQAQPKAVRRRGKFDRRRGSAKVLERTSVSAGDAWPALHGAVRGRGSVGRASPCQGEGRGFESRRPLGGAGRRVRGRRSTRLPGPVFLPATGAEAAEWPSGLGKGLQSPVRGFDSRLRLEGG